MDKKLEMPLSIFVGGYIFSLGFYFVWCFYVFYEKLYRGDYLLVVVAVVFAITAVYFLPFLLILYIKPLQKVWTSSSLVSLITLLIFFLIPLANYKMYYKFYGKKLNLKQDETVETILNNPIATNDSANRYIKELQAKLEFERKINTDLTKQLNEIIRKIQYLENEQKTKGDIVSQTKSNKNISKIKINSKILNTESDTKNQEITFKVQIISSSTRLAKYSPQFNGLNNIWEYKDSDLYKYTLGNQRDLKSASALQSELQRKGFSGAFVVAFKNGKRIPVREAKKLLTVSE